MPVRHSSVLSTPTDPDTTVESNCTDDDVRLVGGANPLEGRVEFCLNRAWGTICRDRFGESDASVVCRQLDFDFTGAEVVSISEFTQGEGPVFLDQLSCGGDEERLDECRRGRPTGLHTCDHSQDVAIRCIGENRMMCRVREVLLVLLKRSSFERCLAIIMWS